jgi:hypothetical protein
VEQQIPSTISQGEQKYIERPSTMKINIVIADDHDLVGKSVAALLTSIPDFEVVGQCENGRDLIELVSGCVRTWRLLIWECPA